MNMKHEEKITFLTLFYALLIASREYTFILTVKFDVLGYTLVHGKLICIVLNREKLGTTIEIRGS